MKLKKNTFSSILKKRMISLMLCVLMMLNMLACGQAESLVTEEKSKDDKIQVGICFDSFLIERWERDRDVFVSTAKDLGAEVNVQNANGSLEEQISQIEYLIDKRVDVIVIVCIDAFGLSDVVKKAKEEGITVVSYDRMIQNADCDLYVSFDNEKVGTMMAEAMIASGLPNKRVLMLAGPTTDVNVSQVDKGFNTVMSNCGVEVVDTMYADGWKPELASDYLYDHPGVLDDIDAIMCGNDSLATQTVRVLAEKRKAGEILVTGQDAELEACQRIVEGTQLMTVYKPVEKEAKMAAECAIALAKGEKNDSINQVISDGTYDIPSIVLEPIAVNRDNMDETIIDSGFHLREEVYLNVGEK